MIEVKLASVMSPEDMVKEVYGKDSIDEVESISKAIDFMVIRSKKMMEKVDKLSKDEDNKSDSRSEMSDDHAEKLKKLIKLAMTEMVAAVNKINGTEYKVAIPGGKGRYYHGINGGMSVRAATGSGGYIPGVETPVTKGYRIYMNNVFAVNVDEDTDLREVFKRVFCELIASLMSHAMTNKAGVMVNILRNADIVFKTEDGRSFITGENDKKINIEAITKKDIKKLRDIDTPKIEGNWRDLYFIEVDSVTNTKLREFSGSLVETETGLVLIETSKVGRDYSYSSSFDDAED